MNTMGNNDVIRKQLGYDESLYWEGKPAPGIRLAAQDAFLIPFSLLWGGFAIFWESSVILSGAPVFSIIFGLPFVLIGLYLIVGRFFIDARQRANTFYGVTNKRIIIIRGLFSQTLNSIQLDTLSDISITSKRNGKGTITFGGQPNPMCSTFNNVSWPGMNRYSTPSFYLIPDVNNVNKIIEDNRERLKLQG